MNRRLGAPSRAQFAPPLATPALALSALAIITLALGGCSTDERARLSREFVECVTHPERVSVSRCEFPPPTEADVPTSPSDPFPELTRVASAEPSAAWVKRATSRLIGGLEYAPDPAPPCRACPLESVFEVRYERGGRIARAFVFPVRNEVVLYWGTLRQSWRPRSDRVSGLVPLFKEALPGDVLTAAMDGKGHLDRAAFQSAHPDRKFLESLPRLVSQVPAEYPEEAQRRKIEGMVVLSVLVGTRGEVDSVRVVRSVGLLDEAAVASAWRWKFEPAISLGEPVAEWIVVPVSFRLER